MGNCFQRSSLQGFRAANFSRLRAMLHATFVFYALSRLFCECEGQPRQPTSEHQGEGLGRALARVPPPPRGARGEGRRRVFLFFWWFRRGAERGGGKSLIKPLVSGRLFGRGLPAHGPAAPKRFGPEAAVSSCPRAFKELVVGPAQLGVTSRLRWALSFERGRSSLPGPSGGWQRCDSGSPRPGSSKGIRLVISGFQTTTGKVGRWL